MVEATDLFTRFSALDGRAINCDLQVHSTWTDGKATLKELAERAKSLGLRRIAFTEHVRQQTDWFPGFRSEVQSLRATYPDVELLVGCEAKALDTRGTLDVSAEVRKDCDIVLGSVHRLPAPNGSLIEPSSLEASQLLDIELGLARGILDNGTADVLAHPLGMYMKQGHGFPADEMVELLSISNRTGRAIEINPSYLRGHFSDYIELCRSIDPVVAVGSDAHDLEGLGRCRDLLRKTRGIRA